MSRATYIQVLGFGAKYDSMLDLASNTNISAHATEIY